MNVKTMETPISARIDALPGSRRLWTMIAILSFGAFFEIYDIALTAPSSLGLLQAGIFRQGSSGLTDQASFIGATFFGLYLGTEGVFLFISGAMVMVALTIGLWRPLTRGLPVDDVAAVEGLASNELDVFCVQQMKAAQTGRE